MEAEHPEASEFLGHPVASDVSERVREVIGAAEAAAGAIRHEAEQQAQARRRAGEEEARRVVEDARRDAEALLAERIRRISDLSDTIIDRGEALLARVARAEEVRRELEALVDALGEGAAKLAHDAKADVSAGPAKDRPAAAADEETPPSGPGEGAAAGVAEEALAPRADEGAAARVGEETPPSGIGEGGGSEPESPAAEEPDLLETEPVDASAGDESVEEVAAERDGDTSEGAKVTHLSDAAEAAGDGDDRLLGARLVALQMAVAGGNRGEVEVHLRHAFELPDPQPILDDVFGPGTDASKRVIWPSAADA